MSKAEWLVDFLVQPGTVEVLDRFSEDASFYLVEKSAAVRKKSWSAVAL